MRLMVYTNAAEFRSAVLATLEQREAANNLMLGLAERLVKHPERFEHAPFLATTHDGDTLAAAAVMTPPFGVVLFARDEKPQVGLAPIADSLRDNGWIVPAINGEVHTADAFLAVWQARTGATVHETMRERVYMLTRVIPPATTGHARLAEERDVPTVARWVIEFLDEAVPHDPKPDGEMWARNAIGDGDLMLWDDGQPVSMARCGRRTTHGASVGPVYTPQAFRGHGYASAVTAALSQHLLDSGKQFCQLFTNLANPTSNSIYQKIGYVPVCDWIQYLLA